jgi:large repetitive protein
MKRSMQRTGAILGGIAVGTVSHGAPGTAEPAPVCGAFQRISFADAQLTGGSVDWEVPVGTTEVRIQAAGGRGGNAAAALRRSTFGSFPAAVSGDGGRGRIVDSRFAVTPGETLTVVVGGGAVGPTAGFNGGGDGLGDSTVWSGGGGGASDVRQGGNLPIDRVIVAGGGGGTGSADWYGETEYNYTFMPFVSPGYYGQGGDAGSDGGVSFGYDNDGIVATSGSASWLVYSVTATGGQAGQSTGVGAAGVATSAPLSFPWDPYDGNPGVDETGGDGIGASSGDSYAGRSASGGGGGGYYGGGSGGAIGFGNASSLVEMLAGGGGGGSSLGTETGFNALVDGYVDIAACAVPAVAPTTTTIAATTTTSDAAIDAPGSVSSTTSVPVAPVEPVLPTQPQPGAGGGALPETGGSHNRELGTAGLFGGLGALLIAMSRRSRRPTQV